MAQGRTRNEAREQQWQRWIGEWRASGLSVRAFCSRRGLAKPSFYAWRRRLEQRAALKTAFVPVQIAGDPALAPTGGLEVVLTDGRTVRVAAGFDAVTLRRLLAVLEEGQPC
jgi:hypothetical protein